MNKRSAVSWYRKWEDRNCLYPDPWLWQHLLCSPISDRCGPNEVVILHAPGALPDYEGQEFSKQLVEHAIQIAKRWGEKSICLGCIVGNSNPGKGQSLDFLFQILWKSHMLILVSPCNSISTNLFCEKFCGVKNAETFSIQWMEKIIFWLTPIDYQRLRQIPRRSSCWPHLYAKISPDATALPGRKSCQAGTPPGGEIVRAADHLHTSRC